MFVEAPALSEDVGSLNNYIHLFTRQKCVEAVQRWLNSERPKVDKFTDPLFYNPIKYILFDLSQAIYENHKGG